ncbi:hypothetical protein M405DRAFT_928325 [Rhizopogon salebrosus TDB-379]|nr:hypothetical protein M405DRAFT_928325 [Rhizopogon salebrosus TDB-379]
MDSEAVITFFLRFFIILGYVTPVTVVTLFRLLTGHVNVTIVASLLVITLVLWIVNLCITVSSDLRLRLYPALTASVLVHFLNLICISTQGLIEIVNPDDRSMLFDISTILTVAILALTWYTVSAIFGRESVGLFAEFSERLGLPVSTTPGDGDPPADGGALDHGGVPNPGEEGSGKGEPSGTSKALNKRSDSSAQSNTSDPAAERFSNEPRPPNTRTLDSSKSSRSDDGTPSNQRKIADTSKPADTGGPSNEPRCPGGPSVPGSVPFFANPLSNSSTFGLPPDDPTTGQSTTAQKGKGRAPDADLEEAQQAPPDDPATGLSNTAQKGNVRVTDTELEERPQVGENLQAEVEDGLHVLVDPGLHVQAEVDENLQAELDHPRAPDGVACVKKISKWVSNKRNMLK